MGHSPITKPNIVESGPDGLRSGTITSLLITGVSRIYSHQQIDDHRKKRNTGHTTNNIRVS